MDLTSKIFIYGAKKKISNFLDDDSEKNNDDAFSSMKKTLGFEDEEEKKKPPQQEEGMFSDFKKKLGFSETEEKATNESERSKSTARGMGEPSSAPPSRSSKSRSERDRIAKKYGLNKETSSSKDEDQGSKSKAPKTSTQSTRPHSVSLSSTPKPVQTPSEQPGFFSRMFGWKSTPTSTPETQNESLKDDDISQDFGSLMILETQFPDVDEAILKKFLRENGGDAEKTKKVLMSKGYKCAVISNESGVSEKSLNTLKKEFPTVDEDILRSTLETFKDDPKAASEYLKKNKVENKKKGWFG